VLELELFFRRPFADLLHGGYIVLSDGGALYFVLGIRPVIDELTGQGFLPKEENTVNTLYNQLMPYAKATAWG